MNAPTVLQRVGVNARRNLVWILSFNRLDLAQLNQQEWHGLQEEVAVFSTLGYRRWFGGIGKRARFAELASGPQDVGALPTPGFKLLAVRLQAVSRIAVAELLKKNWTVLPVTSVQRVVGRSATWGATFPLFERDPTFPFIDQLAEVLRDAGWRLFKCKASNCRKVFILARRGMHYCTPACRSRINMRIGRKRKRLARKMKSTTHKKVRTLKSGGSKHGTKRR